MTTANPLVFVKSFKTIVSSIQHSLNLPIMLNLIHYSRLFFGFHSFTSSNSYHTNRMHSNIMYVCGMIAIEGMRITTKWQPNEMNHDSVESSQQPFFFSTSVLFITQEWILDNFRSSFAIELQFHYRDSYTWCVKTRRKSI